MAAGRKPIIVCDDDQDTLDFLEVLLTQHGYQVLQAHGYKDVLFCLEHVRPSLILMDIRMPEWDGFEVAEMLRRQGHTVPIIFMTAHDNKFSRRYSPHLGADGYFTKPLDENALLEKVKSVVMRPA
jgi:DNA-binding response OmpR family regulator